MTLNNITSHFHLNLLSYFLPFQLSSWVVRQRVSAFFRKHLQKLCSYCTLWTSTCYVSLIYTIDIYTSSSSKATISICMLHFGGWWIVGYSMTLQHRMHVTKFVIIKNSAGTESGEKNLFSIYFQALHQTNRSKHFVVWTSCYNSNWRTHLIRWVKKKLNQKSKMLILWRCRNRNIQRVRSISLRCARFLTNCYYW